VLGAEWIGQTGREAATREHGVELAFSGVDKDSLADLPGACGLKTTPKAPLFNSVDDDGTTQDKIASAVSKYFGIKHDYYGAVTALFAKLSMKSTSFEDMVDDANEVQPSRVVLRRDCRADVSFCLRCTSTLGPRWRPRTHRRSRTRR
jgi:hypothetical protein